MKTYHLAKVRKLLNAGAVTRMHNTHLFYHHATRKFCTLRQLLNIAQ